MGQHCQCLGTSGLNLLFPSSVIVKNIVRQVMRKELSTLEAVTMYRPCNQAELDLVIASDYKRWPPRLPGQPIFYPVTNLQYARDVNAWNKMDYSKGYVTKFDVAKTFVDRYEIQKVGGEGRTEWWIPAEDLEELNDNIVGLIEIVEVLD